MFYGTSKRSAVDLVHDALTSMYIHGHCFLISMPCNFLIIAKIQNHLYADML